MRHGFSGLSTYGLNSHRKGDVHPAYTPVGYDTFTLVFQCARMPSLWPGTL